MRNHSLDGLRGLAAANVVLFHFFCAFHPHLLPEYDDHPWGGSDTPLAILYNGGFAVAVFFVLSGFVISTAVVRSRRSVVETLLQRYLRLALPVTASVFFAWLLLAAFPGSAASLKAATGSRWLDYVYGGNLPGLAGAAHHGLFGVFVSGNSFFNNVLWTMKIELIGSCEIYVIYARPFHARRIWLLAVLLVASLALERPEYGAFAVGALMQEARSEGLLPRRFAWAALVFSLLAGATMQGFAARVLPLADVDAFGGVLKLGEPHKAWHVVAAAALVYAVLNLAPVAGFLAGRVPAFLGRISFGLYLVHVPILYTVMATLYLRLPFGDGARSLVVFAVFLPLALAAGYVFTLLIDEPVIRLVHALKGVGRLAPALGRGEG